jgi:hypothetical protein
VILEKLTLVVDAGTIVHPDGALAQVEGAALWGVSLTLHEGSEFVQGRVKDTNLDTYTPLRMGDVPEMDIEFLPSTEVPTGLGACDHRGRPGDRKRHICCHRRAPAPLANPPGCSSAGSQHKELITWAALRRFKGDMTGCCQERNDRRRRV